MGYSVTGVCLFQNRPALRVMAEGARPRAGVFEWTSMDDKVGDALSKEVADG